MSQVELGQAVDYVFEYNALHKQDKPGSDKQHEEKKEVKKRKATQADWDAFWG